MLDVAEAALRTFLCAVNGTLLWVAGKGAHHDSFLHHPSSSSTPDPDQCYDLGNSDQSHLSDSQLILEEVFFGGRLSRWVLNSVLASGLANGLLWGFERAFPAHHGVFTRLYPTRYKALRQCPSQLASSVLTNGICEIFHIFYSLALAALSHRLCPGAFPSGSSPFRLLGIGFSLANMRMRDVVSFLPPVCLPFLLSPPPGVLCTPGEARGGAPPVCQDSLEFLMFELLPAVSRTAAVVSSTALRHAVCGQDGATLQAAVSAASSNLAKWVACVIAVAPMARIRGSLQLPLLQLAPLALLCQGVTMLECAVVILGLAGGGHLRTCGVPSHTAAPLAIFGFVVWKTRGELLPPGFGSSDSDDSSDLRGGLSYLSSSDVEISYMVRSPEGGIRAVVLHREGGGAIPLTVVPEEVIHWGDGGDKEPCSVCLGPFEQGDECWRLRCQHVFHSQCVAAWFQHSLLCPLCRTPHFEEEESEEGMLSHFDVEEDPAYALQYSPRDWDDISEDPSEGGLMAGALLYQHASDVSAAAREAALHTDDEDSSAEYWHRDGVDR